MKMWIGGAENLKAGDVVTNWSRATESGLAVLEVQRLDHESVDAVIEKVYELGYDELAVELRLAFGVPA